MAATAKTRKKRADRPASTQPTTNVALQRSLRGDLLKLDLETQTLTVQVQKKKQTSEVAVQTDDRTEVLIDGSAATLVDLKPGMKIWIQPETGLATKISAKSLTAKEEKQRRQKHDAAKS